LIITHRLRAAHQAILVGLGTILADDPRLTVRLVEGADPQPVIVDTHLRIPLESSLMTRTDLPPIIFYSDGANTEPQGVLQRREALQQRGARLVACPLTAEGKIDLHAAVRKLREFGIRSLMIEGGARIISHVLTRRLADLAVITLCPVWLGGLRLTETQLNRSSGWPSLEDPIYEPAGGDLVIWGKMMERKL
jgi:3,4-dihydroxy 2-butanone 4-phosphate synthase/GTP cyclohydrolase II